MATDPDNYSPIYIDQFKDDLPVAGPDDFPNGEKRRAAFEAEVRLENDVNSGKTIPSKNRSDTHTAAALLFATYRLQSQIEHPTDTRLGDVHEDNTARNEESAVGSQYLDGYNELVDRINERSETGSPGVYFGAAGDGTQTGTAVNTREDGIMSEYPFTEDDRFPLTGPQNN